MKLAVAFGIVLLVSHEPVSSGIAALLILGLDAASTKLQCAL